LAVYEAYSRETILQQYQKEGTFAQAQILHNDLSAISLPAVRFYEVEIAQCHLSKASFSQAECEQLQVKQTDLTQSNWKASQHKASVFLNCYLIKADFSDAGFFALRMKDCVAHSIRFERARLVRSQFIDNEMYKSQFVQCVVMQSLFAYRGQSGMANLSKARLTGSLFSDCSFKGVNLQESCLAGSVFISCDFTGAQLDGADTEQARFINCQLTGTGLEAKELLGAKQRRAGQGQRSELDWISRF
jgi:uncharacterized protein YjbI with pentapeptide repeats